MRALNWIITVTLLFHQKFERRIQYHRGKVQITKVQIIKAYQLWFYPNISPMTFLEYLTHNYHCLTVKYAWCSGLSMWRSVVGLPVMAVMLYTKQVFCQTLQSEFLVDIFCHVFSNNIAWCFLALFYSFGQAVRQDWSMYAVLWKSLHVPHPALTMLYFSVRDAKIPSPFFHSTFCREKC